MSLLSVQPTPLVSLAIFSKVATTVLEFGEPLLYGNYYKTSAISQNIQIYRKLGYFFFCMILFCPSEMCMYRCMCMVQWLN